ncbi:hypothetical protein Q3G72_028960 [Acer saccharum]|nr:hypothetical protein Q3G72_028960 [Acer saccharum]
MIVVGKLGSEVRSGVETQEVMNLPDSGEKPMETNLEGVWKGKDRAKISKHANFLENDEDKSHEKGNFKTVVNPEILGDVSNRNFFKFSSERVNSHIENKKGCPDMNPYEVLAHKGGLENKDGGIGPSKLTGFIPNKVDASTKIGPSLIEERVRAPVVTSLKEGEFLRTTHKTDAIQQGSSKKKKENLNSNEGNYVQSGESGVCSVSCQEKVSGVENLIAIFCEGKDDRGICLGMGTSKLDGFDRDDEDVVSFSSGDLGVDWVQGSSSQMENETETLAS